jgi:hypothetical protein
LGWAVVVVITIGISIAATWRVWLPAAVRVALKARGIQVERVRWEGTNSWTFEGVERAEGGLVVRAKTITMLRPKAWQAAVQQGDTNQVYVRVNGWRVILPAGRTNATAGTNATLIAEKVQQIDDGLRQAQSECPRAVFLNGTLQTAKGDFNFAAVEWKGGELSGDFTWPRLNDPADFRLRIMETGKLQLIVRQRALEIGVRATSEVLDDGARLAGYVRWKTNRVDFDATYPFTANVPRHAVVDSKGLSVPGLLVGLPEAESLNARMRLVITNGQFDFALGTPTADASGQ